jgi:anti-sigma factor RsiW
MKQCLGHGELRAWRDGELPAEQAPLVERHLAECAACAAAYQEVAERATRVSSWMESLSADIPARPSAPERVRVRPVVWAAVAALAAAIVLAVILSRPHAPAPLKAIVEAPPAPEVVVHQPPVVTTAAVSAPAPRVRRSPQRAARSKPVEYYMALDEEPIETGLVMRVALPSGMQADVIVDGDGRARAIRPISYVKEQ